MGPGHVLSDRYVLGERLGRGGMAEVFRAHDRRLGREVAVKVLASHLLQDPAAVRQLQREARSAASVRHPGVVAVFDAGSDEGTHYLVMEVVDGPTLSDVLADEGALDPRRAVTVGAAIADAVHAAHGQGIVHRDLKPSNVLFDPDGRVRVTDFGIAHAAAGTVTATSTALIAGSVPYLAPEQARGEDPTPAADVYALGCVLFEALTGRRPFEGATPAAVIAAHLHAQPPRPSSLRPELPRWLDDVVLRALAKDASDRQPDAATLAEELRRGPDGAATTVGAVAGAATAPDAATETVVLPPADPDPGEADRRPRPWGWALGGAVAAMLLAAVIVVLTQLVDDDATAPVAGASPTVATSPAAGPSPSPTVSPSPTPTPTPAPTPEPEREPEPDDPAAAAALVRERIDEARRSFEIEEDDADDLDDRLAEVVEKHREGEQKEARKKLGELRRKVDELARKGEIDEDLQADLHTGLDRLEATL